VALYDHGNDIVYEAEFAGIMKMMGAVPGDEILGTTSYVLQEGSSCFHPRGFLFTNTGGGNSALIQRILASNLTLAETYGTSSSSFAASQSGRQVASYQMIGPVSNGKGWLVSVGARSAFLHNEIGVLYIESNPMILAYAWQIDEG
jgi:hypothetical protein